VIVIVRAEGGAYVFCSPNQRFSGRRKIAKKKRDFDPHAFLATLGEGRKSVLFRQKQGIFAQGDTANAVFLYPDGQGKTHCGLEDW
jgi:hypothetical protein